MRRTLPPTWQCLVGDELQARNPISFGVLRIDRHLQLHEVLTCWRDRRIGHGEVFHPATGVKITYHEKVMPITSHSKIKKCGPPRWPVQGVIAQQHPGRLQLRGDDGDPGADRTHPRTKLD